MSGVSLKENICTVTIDTAALNAYPRDITIYLFTRVNVVIVYGPGGVRTIGR